MSLTVLNFAITVATIAGIYGIMCLALNLEFGHAGLINFGIVAYFAAGSYTYAVLTQPPPGLLDSYVVGLSLPSWVGFAGAGVAGLVMAAITGWPCLRLRGEYLALTTFAFAEVFHSFLVNERRVTNGTVGFTGIERPFLDVGAGLTPRLLFALLVLVCLALVFVASRRLVTSPYGRTLRAIRDDEVAAALAQKPVERRRLEVFLFGALVIGFAGALYAWFTTVVTPALFTAEATFVVWIALVLGGVGSNWGAVWGAFVLIGFEELIRFLNLTPDAAARVSSLRTALVGLLLILLLRFRPTGAARRALGAERAGETTTTGGGAEPAT